MLGREKRPPGKVKYEKREREKKGRVKAGRRGKVKIKEIAKKVSGGREDR